MNFTEVVAEVVSTAKRPDKIAEIRRHVNTAINFYCLDSEFVQDYAEQGISLDPNEYIQAFGLDQMTRFRRFKYLKRGGTKCYLQQITDLAMLSGMTDCDKYYIVGTNVNIALRALAATLDVGYFQYPPVLNDQLSNNSFWMLDQAPWMVIDRACAALFRSIGDEKSMQFHAGSARELYLAFLADQKRGGS